MEERDVYILLTRTSTVFSRMIHAMTGDEYTHAAIGIDGCAGAFYGFGRKYPSLPFPGAFRQECPWRFKHDTPCRIYRLRVPLSCYSQIESVLQMMLDEPFRYHYNIVGVITCKLGVPVPRLRKHHFFCSQFVAWLLGEAGAIELPVDAGSFRPSDFCYLDGVELAYEGQPLGRSCYS